MMLPHDLDNNLGTDLVLSPANSACAKGLSTSFNKVEGSFSVFRNRLDLMSETPGGGAVAPAAPSGHYIAAPAAAFFPAFV